MILIRRTENLHLISSRGLVLIEYLNDKFSTSQTKSIVGHCNNQPTNKLSFITYLFSRCLQLYKSLNNIREFQDVSELNDLPSKGTEVEAQEVNFLS